MKVCANTPQNEASSIRNSWTPSISSMARRLNQVAIPAIILFNLSNLPGADGGLISYGACVAACAGIVSLTGSAAVAATGGAAFVAGAGGAAFVAGAAKSAYMLCLAECVPLSSPFLP